jgi:hypothetical protein
MEGRAGCPARKRQGVADSDLAIDQNGRDGVRDNDAWNFLDGEPINPTKTAAPDFSLGVISFGFVGVGEAEDGDFGRHFFPMRFRWWRWIPDFYARAADSSSVLGGTGEGITRFFPVNALFFAGSVVVANMIRAEIAGRM